MFLAPSRKKKPDVVDAVVRKHEAKAIADIGWTPEAREAARAAQAARAQREGRQIGKGMAKVFRQEQQNQRKFPVGSQVQLNRMGAEANTVIGHNGPMVQTSGGEFHHTKIVAVSAPGQRLAGLERAGYGRGPGATRVLGETPGSGTGYGSTHSGGGVLRFPRSMTRYRSDRARGGLPWGMGPRVAKRIEAAIQRDAAEKIMADIGWTPEAREAARAAQAAKKAGKSGQGLSKKQELEARVAAEKLKNKQAGIKARAAYQANVAKVAAQPKPAGYGRAMAELAAANPGHRLFSGVGGAGPNAVPAPQLLNSIGFNHTPGSGYKPELDPYQHYQHSDPNGITHADAHHALLSAGFSHTNMGPVMGGSFAASYRRTTGPYREESVVLNGTSAAHINRATHYSGGSYDRATIKLLQQHEAKQIVDQLVGKE